MPHPMDRTRAYEWDGRLRDCVLTIPACDDIEDRTDSSLETLIGKMAYGQTFRRADLSLVLWHGLQGAGVGVSRDDVRESLHRRSYADLSAEIDCAIGLLMDAVQPDTVPAKAETPEEEAGDAAQSGES